MSRESQSAQRRKSPENDFNLLKKDLKYKKPASSKKPNPDVFNDQFYVIQNMWDYLGVSANYRNIFINIAKELDPEIEKDFYDFEIKNLKKLNDILGVIKLINKH